MQILQKSGDRTPVTIKPENLDDLWELSHILQEGDSIRADTERKVAVGGDRSKQVRKPMRLAGDIVETELQGDILRIQVTITDGPEDWVSHGDHHSFSITSHDNFELDGTFDSVRWQRLQKTTTHKPHDILIVTFDREQAWIAQLTHRGYEVLQTLKGDVAKKAPGGGSENFYKTLAKAVTELDERMKLTSIIVASPAFWTDYLVSELPQHIKKKTTTASCSAVGESALSEVLMRSEVRGVLEEDQTAQEQTIVDRILEAVGKDNACYGIDECEKEATNARVTELVVTNTYIKTAREEGFYERIDAILQQVQNTQGEVHLIGHVTKQIDSLGGIAGVRRW
jgi:protein pelota